MQTGSFIVEIYYSYPKDEHRQLLTNRLEWFTNYWQSFKYTVLNFYAEIWLQELHNFIWAQLLTVLLYQN